MKQPSLSHFGLLVAYVLPGFIVLAGLAPVFPAVANWLQPVDQGDLGIGPPVYALMAATALGLILTCFRWVILDHVHAYSGVRRPTWDDRQLHDVLGGFDYLVQNHFRYYEFFGNAMVAGLFAYAVNRAAGSLPFLGPGTDLGMILITCVLFAASRDALGKYYSRTSRLIGQVSEKPRRPSDVRK
ncbi:MAG TPA: hypothetical protein VEA69_02940 [Tepidisphaeraceae bacterium]|nr:hypothetical protein [Tepidisphaeraceae bacterium]